VPIPYPWMMVLSLIVRFILHSLASNAFDYILDEIFGVWDFMLRLDSICLEF
jgi:hypothetical protein